MADDFKSKLEVLLDQYDQGQQAINERAAREKNAKDQFLSAFLTARKDVIRPAFEKIGALLKQRGHDFRITQEEPGIEDDKTQRMRAASVTMYIFPAGYECPAYSPRWENSYPFLEFRGLWGPKVGVRCGTMLPSAGGESGPRGEYQLSQIDEAFIEAEVLRLVAAIVKKKVK